MHKHVFILIFFILGIINNASSQKFESLKKAHSDQELNDSTSIIYGSFIQRLGFTSGGFTQVIRLQEIVTQKMYTFNVKPAMKSSKEHSFCYYIKPGMYKILNYFWIQSKWYGAEMHEEYIFKHIDTSTKDFKRKYKEENIDTNQFDNYYIEIKPNTVNYLGTWHFNTGLVSFSDDKAKLDKKLQKKYKKINLEKAIVKLPE